MRGAALVLLVASGALALADDKKKDGPFRWDPRQRARLVPGARTFYDYELSHGLRMSFGKGQEVAGLGSLGKTTQSFRWVRHLVGVESGEISEAEVRIERWRKSNFAEVDSSLEGRTVTLKRSGGKLAASLDDPTGVSSDAREWLESEVFRSCGHIAETDYMEDLLLVREPAAVTTGCEWTRDPKALALGLFQTTDVDAERSSVKGKLEDVRLERGVHYGRASVKAELQLRKLDLSELHYTDGVRVELSWTYEGSLEPARREDSTRSLSFVMTGRSKVRLELETETTSERTETLKCGPVRK